MALGEDGFDKERELRDGEINANYTCHSDLLINGPGTQPVIRLYKKRENISNS